MAAAAGGVLTVMDHHTRPDRELLAAFSARADPEAFAELARRTGGMVYATCRRVLGECPPRPGRRPGDLPAARAQAARGHRLGRSVAASRGHDQGARPGAA
jgi:hypothetical protein